MEPRPGMCTKSARTVRVMTGNRRQEGTEPLLLASVAAFRIRKDVKGFGRIRKATR